MLEEEANRGVLQIEMEHSCELEEVVLEAVIQKSPAQNHSMFSASVLVAETQRLELAAGQPKRIKRLHAETLHAMPSQTSLLDCE